VEDLGTGLETSNSDRGDLEGSPAGSCRVRLAGHAALQLGFSPGEGLQPIHLCVGCAASHGRTYT
jgi:hypothetical protein